MLRVAKHPDLVSSFLGFELPLIKILLISGADFEDFLSISSDFLTVLSFRFDQYFQVKKYVNQVQNYRLAH